MKLISLPSLISWLSKSVTDEIRVRIAGTIVDQSAGVHQPSIS